MLEANAFSPRLGVCLDTCHVFAAGYDLACPQGYARMWCEFEAQVGLERLRAVHLNDSQRPLGSRVDRHAHIGEGEIGEEAFHRLLHDPRLQAIPMILETPEMETMHRANLDRLKRLRRLPLTTR